MKLVILSSLALLAPMAATAQTTPAAPPPAATPADPSAPAAPAAAQAAPTVGATVYDAAGEVVGTIDSVNAQTFVISTGTVKAAVPVTALGTGEKGPTLGMSKTELEAASQAQTGDEFKSKLVAGTAVHGTGGSVLGTIKEADAQFVTLTTPKGDVKLPITGFGPGPQGVTVGLTGAQLDAAMKGTTAK